MKRIVTMIMILSILTFAVFAKGQNEEKQDNKKVTVLKFAHHYPMGHPHTLGVEYFKKLVEERSEGEIEIQLYPNNQMGNSHQIFENLMLGSLDIILTDPGAPAFADIPLWDMVMGPFMYRDYEHAYKVAHSPMMANMYKDLEKELDITIIDPIWFYGVRHLTTAKTPVKTPEDLVGLKIRTPDIPGFIKAIEVIGGTPTPLSFADLYLALKQGVVDGQENPMGVIDSKKFYEAQKYLILTGHMLSKNTVYMSSKSLKKLSTENQQIIKEAIDEAGRYNDKLIEKSEKETMAKLESLGMTVITPDVDAFREKAMKGLQEWFDDDKQEFFDKIQKM